MVVRSERMEACRTVEGWKMRRNQSRRVSAKQRYPGLCGIW